MKKHIAWAIAFFVIATGLAGCQAAKYAAYEQFGVEKRHLLKNEVEEVQKDQDQVAESFRDALARLEDLYQPGDTNLERQYKKLKSDYEDCESRSQGLEKRMDQVRTIARDLFSEWEAEIAQIQSSSLRSKSRQSLADTKTKYASLDRAMTAAEGRIEPALASLRDHVLYLKHNLNAQAIGILRSEVDDIQGQVNVLVEDMNRSIAEAQSFIKTLE